MTVTAMLMNKNASLAAVRPYTTIERVIELMMKGGTGSVVVLNDSGVLEGIIAERDVLKAIDTRLSLLQPLQAKDIMSRRVPTCSLDDSESTLMDRMIECGVQYLPVIDGSETIAVVSMTDLVATRVSKVKSLMREISDSIHIEKHLEYFTRHLKPLGTIGSSMVRERRIA